MDLAAFNNIERLALVELLADLDEEQLETQSLCDAWSVRDVLAHLVTPYLYPPSRVVGDALRQRGFAGAMESAATKVREQSLETLLEALRGSAEKPFVPPLLGLGAPLTDAVVHGEDIRVPLGLRREVPADHIRAVLDFGSSWRASPVFVPYRRLSGIRFVASDIGWSTGRGKTVRGDALEVALAMFGRCGAAEGLTGDGPEVLAARYSD